MRKQNKRELSRASLGGDEDLLAQQQHKATAQGLAAKADFAPNAAAADHLFKLLLLHRLSSLSVSQPTVEHSPHHHRRQPSAPAQLVPVAQ
ncbi:hypothetical protein E2562_019595 [Oryza meyeriana var. granulata]|uniref:Uncharacterized protein n=1 Tax=Oryza meyeriana var. granulata TaxID=110450 RepID=A0A6G1EX97_9ORYZ|nr:hypothetical protein E2562_019595 [Oryza meyeriana var. granulata]